MKSLQELKALKEKMQQQQKQRDAGDENTIRVVVGMATCGIAAGARPVLNKLVEEVTTRNLANVQVVQTGCIGMCRLEPIVEIFEPNKEKVTYVKVDEEAAKKIVIDHLVNGNICKEYVINE